jgi:hypothetical protein
MKYSQAAISPLFDVLARVAREVGASLISNGDVAHFHSAGNSCWEYQFMNDLYPVQTLRKRAPSSEY